MPIHRVHRIFSGTTAEWLDANPLLQQGDLALDLTTGTIKCGNGSDRWAALRALPSMPVAPVIGEAVARDDLPETGDRGKVSSHRRSSS